MNFGLVTSLEEWKKLEPEWNSLVKESFNPYPFLEFWYQFNWWQTLGGGEWPEETSQLSIITARKDGQLKGIAPLFSSEKPGFEPALRFIGQVEVTDYLDFICKPEDLAEFLESLLKFIDSSDQIRVKKLELANIESESPTLPILQSVCLQKGRSFDHTILQPAPSIHLPSNWEDYLQSLSKKQRHEVRRKERHTERDHKTELVFTTDPSNLKRVMTNLIKMMRHEEKKAEFLTPLTEQYLFSLADQALSAGQLNLASLMLDDQQAATYFNFLSGNKLWVYNTGWNLEFSKSSPGWVLLTKLIQWAIENGLDEVDLMRGNEDYKYRFGGVDRQVVQIRSAPLT